MPSPTSTATKIRISPGSTTSWGWAGTRIAWHENRIDEVTADFAAARVVASGAEGGIVLGSADLDRNGYPDLLGSTPHASQFQNPCVPEDDGHRLWYPNRLANEGGGFAAAEPISELAAGSVEAADVDGDEDPDLIWELFNGIGSTPAAQQNRLGEEGSAFPPLDVGTIWGSEVASSDLDGDLDFIAVSEGPAVVGAVWLENPGTNPDDPDSDGFQDGAEVDAASDPNDPDSTPVPEPAAAIGMLAALATLARLRRRSGCRGRAPARASTSCLI